MNFVIFLLIHCSCAFRINVTKTPDQNLEQKESHVANEIKKLDKQTKDTLSSINKDYDIMMQMRNHSVLNVPEFKRQISVINEKQVCCSNNDPNHKYDIDNAANTKSHRCISISHKFPLRFDNKIFSRSIQEEQKPEVEKVHVDLEDDMLDYATSDDDEHRDTLVGDASILSPSIMVIGDNVDVDTENAKFRRQVTKTKQICCGNGENGNDGDFKKNSRISLIHKVSPLYQNKMFSKTALENAPSQVFVTNDLFKEVQFLMNDY